MKQITKNIIGKNKWIVFPEYDTAEFSLYETLREAKWNHESCAQVSFHRDGRFGYVERDDQGRGTYYGRISSITDAELDQFVEQKIQGRLDEIMERIEEEKYREENNWWEMRADGRCINMITGDVEDEDGNVVGKTTINWGGLK